MSGVERITITAEDADQRLDRFLKRRYEHLGQGQIEKWCRKGELRLDGGRCKASSRLSEGQELRIPPRPAPQQNSHEETTKRLPARISDADTRMIQAAVIYKDDDLLVLNKPAGIPTQGGSKQTRHIDGLSEVLRFGYEDKPRLVHRLDKAEGDGSAREQCRTTMAMGGFTSP